MKTRIIKNKLIAKVLCYCLALALVGHMSTASARYMQADPIGLAGGSFSTYAYVNDNPVMAVDPEGLENGCVDGGCGLYAAPQPPEGATVIQGIVFGTGAALVSGGALAAIAHPLVWPIAAIQADILAISDGLPPMGSLGMGPARSLSDGLPPMGSLGMGPARSLVHTMRSGRTMPIRYEVQTNDAYKCISLYGGVSGQSFIGEINYFLSGNNGVYVNYYKVIPELYGHRFSESLFRAVIEEEGQVNTFHGQMGGSNMAAYMLPLDIRATPWGKAMENIGYEAIQPIDMFKPTLKAIRK